MKPLRALAGKVLTSADTVLSKSINALAPPAAHLRARLFLNDKTDLTGGKCHCPDNLPVHYVHSEGIREACDIVFDFGTNIRPAYRRQYPVEATAFIAGNIGRGDTIHVKSELLGEFCRHVLPGINKPIILVTGDSDYAPVRDFQHLLTHKMIFHWFAQNCDLAERHPHLTRIPIGLDNPVYNKLEKRIGFAVEMMLGKTSFDATFSRNDIGNQLRFSHHANRSIRPGEKPLKVLCTFHMNQKIVPDANSISPRVEALRALSGNPLCHFIESRLKQDECWKIHSQYAFEASPQGKGMDCFRTWEALGLGTIPIVKRSSLDPLFEDEGFPVVLVDSYEEATEKQLTNWRNEMSDRFDDQMIVKLTNDYWVNKIRQKARQARHEK